MEKNLKAQFIALRNRWYQNPNNETAIECNRIAQKLVDISDDYCAWLDETIDMIED